MNSEGPSYHDNRAPFMEPLVQQHGSSMVMTGVYRPTKVKYLNIDTRFSEHIWMPSSVSPTEIAFNLPERVKNVSSIKVKSIEVPITFFNISKRLKNNSLYIVNTQTNVPTVVIIPDGNYASPPDVMAAINLSLSTTVYSGLLFSLSSTQKTTIHLTSNLSVTINFFVSATDPMRTQQLGWILGFRQPSVVINSQNTITSDSIASVNVIKYIYLVVDEFSNNFQMSFLSTLPNSVINKKILARIELDPTKYTYGSILVGNDTTYLASDYRKYNGLVSLQKLNLQLVNEWGLGLDCNGMDYSFLLEIEYE